MAPKDCALAASLQNAEPCEVPHGVVAMRAPSADREACTGVHGPHHEMDRTWWPCGEGGLNVRSGVWTSP